MTKITSSPICSNSLLKSDNIQSDISASTDKDNDATKDAPTTNAQEEPESAKEEDQPTDGYSYLKDGNCNCNGNKSNKKYDQNRNF